MDGKGEFVWPDGRKYIGHYVEDKKHGFGEFGNILILYYYNKNN